MHIRHIDVLPSFESLGTNQSVPFAVVYSKSIMGRFSRDRWILATDIPTGPGSNLKRTYLTPTPAVLPREGE
jgi:hypothetical protein